MEKNFFTKVRITNLIIAAALIVLGIVFCATSNRAGDFFSILGYICGGVLLAVGILFIVMYFVNFKKEQNAKDFIYGGLAIVFGLILIISGGFIATLMILAVGFFLCALGIIYMAQAFEKLRVGDKNIWRELLYGIVSFILGIVLLILLLAAPNVVVIFMGIALILAGLCLGILVCLGNKIALDIKKQLANEEQKEEKAKSEKKEENKAEQKSEKKTTKKTTKKSDK